MGSGASRGPVGVPANPRVQYSSQLRRKEGKDVLVDAPVLVDIDHGSVRYREAKKETDKALKGKEHPFEKSPEDHLDKKDHYFYHARLNEYGPGASKEKEEQFKFYYVTKGPVSAQHRKIFYVYGQGWNAKDGQKVKPSQTVGEGKDYAWSSSVKPNSLYYNLEIDDSEKQPLSSDENKLLEDLESTPNKSTIQMTVGSEENVLTVKARLAIKMLKTAKDIHIAFNNKELRDVDIIGDFRVQQEMNETKPEDNFIIVLNLVTTL